MCCPSDHLEVLVPSVPQLQQALGRPVFAAVVIGALAVVLVTITVLRRTRARRSAAVLAWGAILVALLSTSSVTLIGWEPLGAAAPRLYLDPIAGAWGWNSVAWRPVLDNVVLFVPLGALFAAALWSTRAALVWALLVGLSVAIETFQFLVPTGRVANTADVLANAVGAALGILLATVLGARRPPRGYGGTRSKASRDRPASGRSRV